MGRFQILCVTMNQNDFSKIKEMNIHSDVVFANQCDHSSIEEYAFEGKTAKMISTKTRGVGINRNLALCYADAEICLFADDDVTYTDDMEEKILGEFDRHPDADIIIFNLDTDDLKRKQKKYTKTKKRTGIFRLPWGTFRVAFRLSSARKANLWFTTLFGGGSIYGSGEDSKWLSDARKAGLTFYVSKELIGTVSFATSTWFQGYNDKVYYDQGAAIQDKHPNGFLPRAIYYALRTSKKSKIKFVLKIKMMNEGRKGYNKLLSYNKYLEENQKK